MKFCSNCGQELVDTNWPRTCKSCEAMFWQRIQPVAVALQPVWSHNHERNLLLGRRAINPHAGSWALPGGFVEFGELPEEAVMRELEEEMGVRSRVRKYLDSYVTPNGNLLLFFVMHDITEEELERMWRSSSECNEYRLAIEPEELCFISHTERMALFLTGGVYL